MKITLEIRKNVHANAALHYDKAKKLRAKAAGALKAAEVTRKKIAAVKPLAGKKVRVKGAQPKKEWFEKFLFFKTTNGFLALAGREAKQNDLLYSRHLQEGDLFFHADVQGAPAVVLKNGEKAEEQDLLEAAQFAACFSSAWKRGLHNVDVYAVSAKNVDKRAQGEFLGQGAFMIRGERKWFRNVALRLKVLVADSSVRIIPALREKNGIDLMPGQTTKTVMVEKLAKTLGLAPDFSQSLPQGSFDLA